MICHGRIYSFSLKNKMFLSCCEFKILISKFTFPLPSGIHLKIRTGNISHLWHKCHRIFCAPKQQIYIISFAADADCQKPIRRGESVA
jgi:hypothetical protein